MEALHQMDEEVGGCLVVDKSGMVQKVSLHDDGLQEVEVERDEQRNEGDVVEQVEVEVAESRLAEGWTDVVDVEVVGKFDAAVLKVVGTDDLCFLVLDHPAGNKLLAEDGRELDSGETGSEAELGMADSVEEGVEGLG